MWKCLHTHTWIHTDSLQVICLALTPGQWEEISAQPYQDNSLSVHPALTSHALTANTPKTLTAPWEASAIRVLHWPMWHCPCILLLSAFPPSPPPLSLSFCHPSIFSHPLSFHCFCLTLSFFRQFDNKTSQDNEKQDRLVHTFLSGKAMQNYQSFMMINTWHSIHELTNSWTFTGRITDINREQKKNMVCCECVRSAWH